MIAIFVIKYYLSYKHISRGHINPNTDTLDVVILTPYMVIYTIYTIYGYIYHIWLYITNKSAACELF